MVFLGSLGALCSVLLLGKTAKAHRNSAINLEANNRLDNGEADLAEMEDVNSKWQCKPQSPKVNNSPISRPRL